MNMQWGRPTLPPITERTGVHFGALPHVIQGSLNCRVPLGPSSWWESRTPSGALSLHHVENTPLCQVNMGELFFLSLIPFVSKGMEKPERQISRSLARPWTIWLFLSNEASIPRGRNNPTVPDPSLGRDPKTQSGSH